MSKKDLFNITMGFIKRKMWICWKSAEKTFAHSNKSQKLNFCITFSFTNFFPRILCNIFNCFKISIKNTYNLARCKMPPIVATVTGVQERSVCCRMYSCFGSFCSAIAASETNLALKLLLNQLEMPMTVPSKLKLPILVLNKMHLPAPFLNKCSYKYWS